MVDPSIRLLTVSDFNADNFSALLANNADLPVVQCITTPFGQPHQLLMDSSADCWREQPDVVMVWTRPEAVIPLFGRALSFENIPAEAILREVDEFASLLIASKERCRTLLVVTWVVSPDERGLGMLDHRPGVGVANLLLQMNLRLVERLSGASDCYILDGQRWLQHGGRRACNPKLWYMAKIPFGNDVFAAAVEDVKAALRAVTGQARKLVALDLDDTLWGGTVGDVGWENLVLGGHDPEGEALADFQRALKTLRNRGVLLGIVSKNSEAVALEAIEKHPEMILRQDAFVGWRINWKDKAQNLVELASELNLGLQSVVFIDDNPAERARVREALPEVYVPDWPADKMLYRQALRQLSCFDTASITAEDRNRAAMYASDRERRAAQHQVGSLADWLVTLRTKLHVESLNESNLPRAAQLLNKTNQMNLSTRRLTESDFQEWVRGRGRAVWTIRVSDRFGDLGLAGLLGLERDADRLRIVDFVLSCRVMGRQIEESMLALSVRQAQQLGLTKVIAEHHATSKNQPCLDFLNRSGFGKMDGEDHFFWSTEKEYPFPEAISLDWQQA